MTRLGRRLLHDPQTEPVPAWLCRLFQGLHGTWLGRDGTEDMPSCKGAYLLALHLDIPIVTKLRQEERLLSPGWYLYAGSARGGGGIAARVKRHMRSDKPIHWHIDRLTTRFPVVAAFAVPRGSECDLVGGLLETGRYQIAVKGFGSSDCRRCEAHLLRALATDEKSA
ncbi:GIY-YIG nuclease family protein [Hoeflea sp.]|uniref:GIY-YIG nuclease family protein n=1 Tax=Hoeflea sp. TaxID=1940281 RepID=UPI003B01B0AF